MNEQLARKVITLARARRSAALKQLALKVAKEQLEATKEWAAYTQLKDEQTQANALAEEFENSVRAMAVAGFDPDNPETHPHPAVEVVNANEVQFDPDKAVEWCYTADQRHLLKLDIVKFKSLASKMKLSFVTIKKGHAARIASDLTKWEALDE